ncbi:FBD-like protein [Artemisia annua]|uniref:FBD-like protein n=1 Tax=Artemisia annua TaxID=35608 RepID=A0A2U1L0S4_ARTAN|nr:FBD-like protein [Artemisia annua]
MRTSVLSKSWRYSWMWVHNLDFDEIHPVPDLNRFLEFVNRVLEHCKATQVKIFRLNFTMGYVPESVVSKWITEAVRLKVCELHLKVRHIKLPLSFFLNKTLTDISLDFTELHFPLLDGESNITLPCVKTLDIVISSQPHENVSKLIHGCPELRNLSVGIKNCNRPQHYHYKIPTLKRLKLSICQSVSYISPVYLQLPNLEHFFVDGLLCLEFVEEDLDLSSLINAKATCHVKDDGLWVELLERISQAKSISLNITFWNPKSELDVCVEPLPNFPNLKHLEVEGYVGAKYQLIPQILENCSELEHLSIVKPKGGHWNQPEVVPTCMVGNLKTLKYAETRAQDFNRELLNYMLENSNVLKTLTIACDNMFSPSEEQRLLSELTINPRDPKDCRICFVRNST